MKFISSLLVALFSVKALAVCDVNGKSYGVSTRYDHKTLNSVDVAEAFSRKVKMTEQTIKEFWERKDSGDTVITEESLWVKFRKAEAYDRLNHCIDNDSESAKIRKDAPDSLELEWKRCEYSPGENLKFYNEVIERVILKDKDGKKIKEISCPAFNGTPPYLYKYPYWGMYNNQDAKRLQERAKEPPPIKKRGTFFPATPFSRRSD